MKLASKAHSLKTKHNYALSIPMMFSEGAESIRCLDCLDVIDEHVSHCTSLIERGNELPKVWASQFIAFLVHQAPELLRTTPSHSSSIRLSGGTELRLSNVLEPPSVDDEPPSDTPIEFLGRLNQISTYYRTVIALGEEVNNDMIEHYMDYVKSNAPTLLRAAPVVFSSDQVESSSSTETETSCECESGSVFGNTHENAKLCVDKVCKRLFTAKQAKAFLENSQKLLTNALSWVFKKEQQTNKQVGKAFKAALNRETGDAIWEQASCFLLQLVVDAYEQAEQAQDKLQGEKYSWTLALFFCENVLVLAKPKDDYKNLLNDLEGEGLIKDSTGAPIPRLSDGYGRNNKLKKDAAMQKNDDEFNYNAVRCILANLIKFPAAHKDAALAVVERFQTRSRHDSKLAKPLHVSKWWKSAFYYGRDEAIPSQELIAKLKVFESECRALGRACTRQELREKVAAFASEAVTSLQAPEIASSSAKPLSYHAPAREIFGNAENGLTVTEFGIYYALSKTPWLKDIGKWLPLEDLAKEGLTPQSNTEEALAGVLYKLEDLEILDYCGGDAYGKVVKVRLIDNPSARFTLKLIICDLAVEKDLLNVVREISTGTMAKSDNIAKVFGYFPAPELVFDKKNGRHTMAVMLEECAFDLRTYMSRSVFKLNVPPPDKALVMCNIVVQILNGVAAFRKAGVSHGELKPENICFDMNGRIKIIDMPDEKDMYSDEHSMGIIMGELMSGERPPKFRGTQLNTSQIVPQSNADYTGLDRAAMEQQIRCKFGFSGSAFDTGNDLHEAGDLLVNIVIGLLEPDNRNRMKYDEALQKVGKLRSMLLE